MTIKSTIKVFAIIILSCFLGCSNLSAQENVLKVDPFNSLWGNYSLSYERVLNSKHSINLNVSFMPERDLFSFGADMFDMESDITLKNAISGFSVSPEYRFYFGKDKKKSPRGFYIAPYLRASDYKLGLNDTYQGHDTKVDVNLFTTGIGVQLGAHWIFSDVFSLDFQFFGIGVDRHDLKLDYSSKEAGVDFTGYGKSVEEKNSDIPLIGSKIKTEYGKDYIKSTAKAFMPGARGRLTLGIAF